MQLGELETCVLKLAWDLKAGSVKCFYAEVKKQRKVSKNTVQSALERLWRKGVLKRTKQGHAFIYQPKFSREQFTAQLFSNMVTEFESNPSMTLAAFVDQQEPVSEEKWQQLKLLVQQIKLMDNKDG